MTIIDVIENINIYSIIKTIFEVFLLIYAVISVVVIKQINLMARTIKSDSNVYIYFIAYLHLIIVILALAFTVFIL